MLKPAINYVDQISKLKSIIFDNQDKFKYFINNDYINYKIMSIEDSDWNYIQYVSVNNRDEVIGYFSATLNQPIGVTNLGFVNFYLDSKKFQLTFAKDAFSFVDYLFLYKKFENMQWCVTVGNPAEKIYDKFIKKFNGRIVGTFTSAVKLIDGKLYDQKWYELMRTNYIEAKNDNSISN